MTAWKYTLLGTLAFSLASTALGRSLLLAAPAVFSAGHFTRAGPSEAEMERTRFRMRLVARGWSSADAAASGAAADRVMEARLEGPEPGYVATPVMVAEAALTLLTERGLVVESVGPGGVFTTAACFRGTGYVDRLRRNGVAFDVERNGGPDARG